MEHLINKSVLVHLKNESPENAVPGLFVGVEQKHVYLQAEYGMLVIPQENIKYYQLFPEEEQQKDVDSLIKVFIDGSFLTNIPVPPTMNLSSATEEVLKTVWANPDVQSALRGKVQKALEYAPGEVNIILKDAPTPPEVNQDNNSFSMGSSNNPLNTYLSPSEMVSRLQNAGKREKKNE